VLPSGVQDPFTVFACNEQKIAWMRAHGYREAEVAQVRRTLDLALTAYHRFLVDQLNLLTEEQRPLWREFVPQVEYWSSGEVLAANKVHPAWPWHPGSATGS
jgi:hypothetical protein